MSLPATGYSPYALGVVMAKIAIIKLITLWSLKYGVDPSVAVAVAAVESNFTPDVVGITGDVGVFQLNPKSFPDYSIDQLKTPNINIKLGIKYLAQVKKNCVHKQGITWLVCYNYGYKNAKRVKRADLFPYVKKVTEKLGG